MCIANIKNAIGRRTLLIVTFVPVVLLGLLWDIGALIIEYVKELPSDIGCAWRGPEKSSRHLLHD